MRSEADVNSANISRRVLISFCSVAPILLLTGCGRTLPIPPPGESRAAARLNELKESVVRVARRERSLPGLRSLAQIPDASAGMPVADQTLLAAALDLDARERLGRGNHPIRDAEVRAVLARPMDVSRFDRQYFVRRLEEARRRSAADPVYARYISLSESTLGATHCEDMITGETVPCYRWVYRFTAVVYNWMDQWGP
jgi:hypothetical protein